MEEKERDEILYRLDERTKRVDDHLNRLDERVSKNEQQINKNDDRITRNSSFLDTIWTATKATGAVVAGLISGIAGALFGLF